MALLEGHKANFQTLLDAFAAERVALVECKDRRTKKPVAVVCAVNQNDAEVEMVPFARMIEGDPYEELIPPSAVEEPEPTERDPRTVELYKFIAKADFEGGGDYFCFKSGGDGDNGEHLMDLIDLYFKEKT